MNRNNDVSLLEILFSLLTYVGDVSPELLEHDEGGREALKGDFTRNHLEDAEAQTVDVGLLVVAQQVLERKGTLT